METTDEDFDSEGDEISEKREGLSLVKAYNSLIQMSSGAAAGGRRQVELYGGEELDSLVRPDSLTSFLESPVELLDGYGMELLRGQRLLRFKQVHERVQLMEKCAVEQLSVQELSVLNEQQLRSKRDYSKFSFVRHGQQKKK